MSTRLSSGLVGALEEGDLGVRAHRGGPLVEILAVDQRARHAETRQQLLDDVATRAEQRLRRHDLVAGLDLAEQGGGDGRHAGRGRPRGLGAFEQRHALFEHRHGGIGKTGVDEAGILAVEARLGRLHRVVGIALGQEQRFRHFAELRAQRPAMDQPRRGLELGHPGLSASRCSSSISSRNKDIERGWRPGRAAGDVNTLARRPEQTHSRVVRSDPAF